MLKTISNSLYFFCLGILFTLLIYHLGLYISRKRKHEEIYNLYIAAFCMLGIIWICFSVLNEVFFINIENIRRKISPLTQTLTLSLVLIIVMKLSSLYFKLSKKWHAYLIYFLLFINLLLTSFSLFWNYEFYVLTFFVPIFLIFITANFFYIINSFYIICKNKIHDAKLLHISYLIFIIILIIDRIILAKYYYKFPTTSTNYFSPYFIAIITISLIFSYYLVKKFNSEYNQLIDYKNNLEQKVRTRTHELEAAKNKIEEQSRQKTTLFINLAHETKTPLTLIQNYLAKYLANHPPDQELAVVKYNIDKLTRDMVNFLDTEKLERSQVFYNHEQICALSSLLQNKTILFKETAARKKITLERQIEKDLYIKADPAAIDRVLNNLLDNAVKYTEARGKVQVTLFREDALIRLIVSDTGIGIPEEERKHIFSPYHQLSHTKRNIQGLGIGLHIIKLIMDSLNGSITVNSAPDKGSEFIITFRDYEHQAGDAVTEGAGLSQPLEAVKVNPADLQSGKHDPGKRTIFIVEDNLQLVVYLKKELENTYNVYYAVNGKEALEKLATVPEPDIILSDIMMDIMDGLRFREEVIKRKPFRGIPFIFLTAKTGRNERLQGLAQGAVDYICKPFEIKELEAKIKSWILLINLKKFDESIDLELKHKKRLNNFCKEYDIKSREKEVLSLLLEGYRNNIIAGKMFISTNTVKKHIERIRNKLGVSGKKELMECLFNYIYKKLSSNRTLFTIIHKKRPDGYLPENLSALKSLLLT